MYCWIWCFLKKILTAGFTWRVFKTIEHAVRRFCHQCKNFVYCYSAVEIMSFVKTYKNVISVLLNRELVVYNIAA